MTALSNLAPRWPLISMLLDEALELPLAQRDAWLESMGGERAGCRETLRRLLKTQQEIETNDLLGTLPRLDGLAATAPNQDGPAAGDLIGPYRLIAELGRGGMGAVWRAARADGTYQREVALKLPLLNRLRRDLAARFARERNILARLEHPNIARLYDAGVSVDGMPYLAMEFVDGQPLGTWCNARRLGVPARIELFGQVLDAVQYAHANLVIHRDLKPANILVTTQGEVRLLDFGIAKLLADDAAVQETQLTQQAGRALTPDYASPEQIRGEPLTIATDIYSLGVVLCELLCERRPYKLAIESAAQLEMAILSAEPARPSSLAGAESAAHQGSTAPRLARALEGDLDTIVGKALAKAPAQRYATIAEFADDLRRHLRGDAVLARPASWAYRARKFVARNRIVVGAASATAVASLAATMISLHQGQLARTQAQRAEDVKRFVLSIFESAETGAGGTRKTSAVELLAQARKRLDATRFDDAATRVELLTSIGFSTLLLGDTAEAMPVLEQAAMLAAANLEPGNPQRAAAEHAFGRALAQRGEPKRAKPLLEASEQAMRSNRDGGGLVSALRWKIWVLLAENQHDAAVEAAEEALRVADALPPGTPRTKALMTAALVMSNILGIAGRPGRLEHARRGVAYAQELHGTAPSAVVLGMRGELASALQAEVGFDAADAELRLILRDQVVLLGDDHPEVGVTLSRLAETSWQLGDVEAAIAYFTRALKIAEQMAGGTPSYEGVVAGSRLAGAYITARGFSEAQLVLDRAVAQAQVALEPNHRQLSTMRAHQLDLYIHTGRLAEARRLADELLAAPAASPIVTARRQVLIGRLHSANGRYGEAEASLADAAQALSVRKALAIEHARALAALGAARLAAGNAPGAVAALEEAVAIYTSVQPVLSPEHREAQVMLARARP